MRVAGRLVVDLAHDAEGQLELFDGFRRFCSYQGSSRDCLASWSPSSISSSVGPHPGMVSCISAGSVSGWVSSGLLIRKKHAALCARATIIVRGRYVARDCGACSALPTSTRMPLGLIFARRSKPSLGTDLHVDRDAALAGDLGSASLSGGAKTNGTISAWRGCR